MPNKTNFCSFINMIKRIGIFIVLLFLIHQANGQRKSVTYFIYFNSSEVELNNSESIRLESLCDSLSNQKIKSILITGHTDDTNDEESNMILSEKRAAFVKKFLVDKKFNTEIISVSAMGEANPISNNSTEKGKAMNRRVELMVKFE